MGNANLCLFFDLFLFVLLRFVFFVDGNRPQIGSVLWV